MHILVTGGLGHIGSQLIRDLPRAMPQVSAITLLDNLSTQRYVSLFNLPRSVRYTLIEGDVCDPDRAAQAARGVDAVVHLAAITNAEGSFDDPDRVWAVNHGGTATLVAACRAAGVRQFIFPSTTSVYGPVGGLAVEDCPEDELRPQSPYARSKRAAEREVLEATQRGEIAGVVLRLGTIFGPSPGMRFHTAVNTFIYSAVVGKPLRVWSEAVGLVRPYLDLRDGVNALAFALQRPDMAGQIYNLVTLNAALDRILDEVRRNAPDVQIEYTPSRLLNQVSYNVDDSKVRKLGFAYVGDLCEGVRATFELLGGLQPFRPGAPNGVPERGDEAEA
jgi:nucleoside-diphosphate-sugar epimerase